MIKSVILAVALILPAFTFAEIYRTPWQMHDGLEVTTENPLGLLKFNCTTRRHGDICLYEVSAIPAADDPGWFDAPDPNIINLKRVPSYVCQAPVTCWVYGDFSYFQTFVAIPEDVELIDFTISFSGMDDGSRITVFNSVYPDGLVIEGSYVYLGGSGTSNLASYVVRGEINRVVITQVDDCCYHNYLRSAVVVLNGQVIEVSNDFDDDTVPDDEDNCPTVANTDQADMDGDGEGDFCDEDVDGDRINDVNDSCPYTLANDLKAGVPNKQLGVNRWADLEGDGVFNTVVTRGKGSGFSFTMNDTSGCSCAQLIQLCGYGQGHIDFGCSNSVMQKATDGGLDLCLND